MCSPPIFFILPTPLSLRSLDFFPPPPPDLILSPLLPPSSSPGLPLRAPLPRPSPLSSLPSPSPASLPSSSPPVRAAAARSRVAARLGLRMRGGARRVTAGGHGRGGACLAPMHHWPFSPASLPDLRRRLAACVQRRRERQARGERGGGGSGECGGGGSGEIRRGAVRIELREVRCPSPLLLMFHNCP